MEKKKLSLTKKEAKLKAANYCAYQERSQKEVRNKLFEYGLYKNEVEDVLADLIMDGFINEERFAKAFAGGKFRVKKWGRNRIKLGLQQHDISSYCLKRAMAEIPPADYTATLVALIEKKSTTESETNLFKKREKISRQMIYKGYEPELVWEFVKDVVV
ncbi:RecX family transcriptional regulator [Gilvimarinus agarilyticus]|uniref:Regulatory protein RecX n=1 Tax=Reichenbachiella agariperforans TaxID=156994 RepID=A0A1M6N1B7_REIAG|nr:MULTISPECIES: RecX family transcriptional regulator [Reichenbachiella]MBU2886181.1 RecX family transcriptional regulator [Gilvimarinus agarilyticus]MBU2915676.1 RecX family transcriptional regulator [Reichenbachiella agariperforans]RJE72053.1 RecX family transcriptional regulator [Reichenbachiella sp. MSK19-1]SHJ89442.1 regulatory protein [Reichenbachiella agariperforans]